MNKIRVCGICMSSDSKHSKELYRAEFPDHEHNTRSAILQNVTVRLGLSQTEEGEGVWKRE